MDDQPFAVSLLLDKQCYALALIDSGCSSYGLISSRFASQQSFERILITPRPISGFSSSVRSQITEVAKVEVDLDGHKEEAFFYVVPNLSYDVILGLPWMKRNNVRLTAKRDTLTLGPWNLQVQNALREARTSLDYQMVSATAFSLLAYKRTKRRGVQVFSATMADIEKALAVKTLTDPRTKLPKHFHEFLDVFDRTDAEKLPPLRGKGIDHAIELDQQGNVRPEVPWGPLYNMSRDELLVLRRTLTEYLDKGFIRVSNSSAAAPVLFVRKPGGGLRFCVDYRGLNKITKKDRYPLPLIYETLRNIGRAKWYTKLDIIAAFHKIRIAEGDEWMTAFRTRYGLFEWLVTPFGLANAPSTFQKYINWALRGYLDVFCSAYVDDILIYSSGSRREHQEHVRKVLVRLREAGLQVDIDKCEFEVKSVKYLGFIVEAEQGVRMDPAKVSAIQEWQSPTSVKGVQSFIGFANFYRRFIKDFSEITLPITKLVRKDTIFKWNDEAEQSFVRLKKIFTTAPVLAMFNHEYETILEVDASKWCIGGTLFQVGEDGIVRPCAFFSKKNSPAECNYEIYDKEMLAIVRCLEEWDAELRSVEKFEIRSDHKNLEYFMTVRKLTERQMRWSLILSRYNFMISYLKGKDNVRADALSRRDQDIPQGEDDDRLQHRTMTLLKPEFFPSSKDTIIAAPVRVIEGVEDRENREAGESPAPLDKWNTAIQEDLTYEEAKAAVLRNAQKFPTMLGIKVSISECTIDESGYLLFRGRRWVPNSEPLRTGLIQETHDSVIGGHPGREATAALMSRQFFWPNMLQDIRRFVRNCDVCGRMKPWRERRQGFLKPLPVPSRLWREISIDFVTDLPISEGCTNLAVITDRLGKGVILEPMRTITSQDVAALFIRTFYRHHGLPSAIVSDRGTQFVSALWGRVCQLLGIVRRLSTAFHPETDGSTERMNQTVETYVRTFVNDAQDDWVRWMPIAELSINNRDAQSTGVSPFFLLHGYHVEPVQLTEELREERTGDSPVQQADQIVRQLEKAREWAQTAMAVSQQEQEEAANRTRQQAPELRIGDKVWLNLKNVRTTRQSKKLDWKNAKYTVIEVVGTHSYRLNTPTGIHNVFHSDLLRTASTDPLDSQATDDVQPNPILVDDEHEYQIEKIIKHRSVRRGRGFQKQFLVKWTGYAEPTWEPESALQDTTALDTYEATSSEN
jgi:predicted aspartyl protease